MDEDSSLDESPLNKESISILLVSQGSFVRDFREMPGDVFLAPCVRFGRQPEGDKHEKDEPAARTADREQREPVYAELDREHRQRPAARRHRRRGHRLDLTAPGRPLVSRRLIRILRGSCHDSERCRNSASNVVNALWLRG